MNDFPTLNLVEANLHIDNFFEYNNLSSFANALKDEHKIDKNFQISEFSLDNRAKNIINFLFK